ncbi:unnamed protein product [Protopolystoma xenopodis]|uniref:Uncharacterized protein n=1 Tax=Protopolystoma xenopodis TaxID=117903 RepID=A0A3S5ADQ3_9PLAT|nr:unnamed protein product [Protopolystoma xenopodis]
MLPQEYANQESANSDPRDLSLFVHEAVTDLSPGSYGLVVLPPRDTSGLPTSNRLRRRNKASDDSSGRLIWVQPDGLYSAHISKSTSASPARGQLLPSASSYSIGQTNRLAGLMSVSRFAVSTLGHPCSGPGHAGCSHFCLTLPESGLTPGPLETRGGQEEIEEASFRRSWSSGFRCSCPKHFKLLSRELVTSLHGWPPQEMGRLDKKDSEFKGFSLPEGIDKNCVAVRQCIAPDLLCRFDATSLALRANRYVNCLFSINLYYFVFRVTHVLC